MYVFRFGRIRPLAHKRAGYILSLVTLLIKRFRGTSRCGVRSLWGKIQGMLDHDVLPPYWVGKHKPGSVNGWAFTDPYAHFATMLS